MIGRRGSWARLVLGWLGCVALAGIALLPGAPASAQDAGPERGTYLGVVLQDLDGELRDSYGYRGSGGVLISQVQDGSPADRAGLRSGDIVTRLGSRSVDSAAELTRVVRGRRPGDEVSVTVVRDGHDRTVRVRLGEREMVERELRIERDHVEEPGETPESPEAPEAPRREREMILRMPDMESFGRAWALETRPRLGIEMRDLDRELGEYFDRPDGRGVLVTRVLDDTPARRAGLRSGDVIVEVDGRAVESSEDVRRELDRQSAGPVRVTVLRRGERRTLTAELEERGSRSERRTLIRPGRPGRTPTPGQPAPRARLRERAEEAREMQEMRRELEEMRRELEALRAELRARESEDRDDDD